MYTVDLVNLVISAIITCSCLLYVGSKMFNKKVDVGDIRRAICICIYIIMLIILNVYSDKLIKIFMNFLLTGCLYGFVFKENIGKSFTISLITFVYFFISEIIFSVFYMTFSKYFNILPTDNLIISNTVISFIVIIIYFINKNNKNIQKIIRFSDDIKSQNIIIILIAATAIFSRKNFDIVVSKEKYVTNLIVIFLFGMIAYYLYKEKNKSLALSERYDHLLKYIYKYELELTNKSIAIHEFKNQIISIKGFIPEKNKKFNEYVDNIISDIKNMEYNGLKGMEYIPKGGLKGLIYYKLSDLKGINVSTSIDSKIKRHNLFKCNSQLYNDVLKIIGIYLDNAIEACNDSKTKEIAMEIYCVKEELHFILTNTYNEIKDIHKFEELGYSTKGKNRGYGLHLVKKIIDKYDNIEQAREINEKYYTVHLIVKL